MEALEKIMDREMVHESIIFNSLKTLHWRVKNVKIELVPFIGHDLQTIEA